MNIENLLKAISAILTRRYGLEIEVTEWADT